MVQPYKDFTRDFRFKIVRFLSRGFIKHSAHFLPNIKIQHTIAKKLLPRIRDQHVLVNTIYGFPIEIEMSESHTASLRGSIERNLYFMGTYEAGTLDIIRRSLSVGDSNAVFVDIGAHNGLMSIFAAKNGAKHVYSFEPYPSMFELLKRNIAHAGVASKITPYKIAVSDGTGEVSLEYDDSNSGATKITQADNFSAKAPTEKIDFVAEEDKFGKISLMIIDVEGHEASVLEGARNIIQTDKPDLIVEYNPKNTNQTVLDFLKREGYLLYFLTNSRHLVGNLQLFDRAPQTDFSDNLFCFQPERAKLLGLI
jgi:FkbM family methyltransferase